MKKIHKILNINKKQFMLICEIYNLDKKEIEYTINKVYNFFNKDNYKCNLWFKTQNPYLGYFKPYELFKLGKFFRLKQFIDCAINGELDINVLES